MFLDIHNIIQKCMITNKKCISSLTGVYKHGIIKQRHLVFKTKVIVMKKQLYRCCATCPLLVGSLYFWEPKDIQKEPVSLQFSCFFPSALENLFL